MSPRRAQVTALLDQLDAAGDHALRNLTGVAGHLGGQLTEQSPPPALRRILTRLDTHLKAGQLTTCRHLSPNAEQTPLPYRRVLAELFADAEAHNLGVLTVGFVAHRGQHDAAADFIEARLPFVTDAAAQRGDLR